MEIYEEQAGTITSRIATLAELKEAAKRGNVQAIKELIILAGGWSALSAAQKDNVLKHLCNMGDGVI